MSVNANCMMPHRGSFVNCRVENLLLEDGHCLRDQALAVCGFPSHGLEDFRASSLETLRQMVAAGMGCTLLPALARPFRVAHRCAD